MDLRAYLQGEHDMLRYSYKTSVASVPRELWRERPDPEGNSIAWIVWHLARNEDVVVNTLIRGVPQVFVQDGWVDRICVNEARIGAGFGAEDVAMLSDRVDLTVLDEYARAVARSTRLWLDELDLDQLDQVPDIDQRLERVPEVVPDRASWVLDVWRDKPAHFHFSVFVIRHGNIHYGEVESVRAGLGIRGA